MPIPKRRLDKMRERNPKAVEVFERRLARKAARREKINGK